jgi:hypothetical protein
MKIRIKGNSLRYRLTKSDVSNLAKHGYIEEHTYFGEQRLTYALQSKVGGTLSANFENNEITVFMDREMIREWASTDRVGFGYDNDGLMLLIEKDFTCLDNVAEDQSDNYPNPLAQKSFAGL